MTAPNALREMDYLKTWASFVACNLVGSVVAGAVAGGIAGGVLGIYGASPKTLRLAGEAAGFLASLPVSYFFFRLFVAQLWWRKNAQAVAAAASPDNAVQ